MQLLDNIKAQIVNPIIMLLFGVALLYFFWGLFEFLQKKDSASGDRKELYGKMIYGAIGMAIMASAFGIMQFLLSTMCALVGQSC